VEFVGDVDSFMAYVQNYYRAVHTEQLKAEPVQRGRS
jgi:thiamine pyrophosphokinase